jgi:methionine-rich copper-binding protein CopC
MPHRTPGRLRAALLILGVAAALALPLSASAHSEFVSSTPADGDTVSGTPTEIVLTFSAALDPKKSSIVLKDASGAQLAKAGVDPAKNTVMRMTPPALDPGAYEIDWTSVATDGDLLRGKVQFTVEALTPSPSPTPAATAAPSVAASAVASPSPSPTLSPAPSAPPGPAGGSGTDVILPVIVAIVVIAALGARLLRRRNDGGTR